MSSAKKAVNYRAIVGAVAAVVLADVGSSIATVNGTNGQSTTVNIVTAGATALSDLNQQTNSYDNLTRLGLPVPTGFDVNGLPVNNWWKYGPQTTVAWNDTFNYGQKVNGGLAAPADNISYMFHKTGSIEGIMEMADSHGITARGLTAPAPGTGSNQWYVNGIANTSTLPANANVITLAWSDVKPIQAFAKAGTANLNATPGNDGYGKGPGALPGSSTNFQQYVDVTKLTGSAADSAQPAGSRLSGLNLLNNQTVAMVPFAVVASPGTGMTNVSSNDIKWLNVTGRLQNGLNLNVATRDAGSGTRNQGANNNGYDPSWAAGERDRISSAPAYTVTMPDGTSVTVNPGDEAAPLNNLTNGTTTLNAGEERVGPNVHFADKTGGGRVRDVVNASRLGIGLLSAGDASSSTRPRVLAVNYNNTTGTAGVMPTADNVTTGAYKMWSQEQMVTVKNADSSAGVRGEDPNSSINIGGTETTGATSAFMANIQASTSNYTTGSGIQSTPADGILGKGFILPKFMAVTKDLDGGAQTGITRGDESGYQTWKNSTGATALKWRASAGAADLSRQTTNDNGLTYQIYGNDGTTLLTPAITITTRTVLAGDFNNDGVRDLNDVQEMAKAYVTGSTTDGVTGDNLTVLSDFNAKGNVSGSGNGTYTAGVTRENVKFFLNGLAVDSTAGGAYSTTADKNAYGLREGTLKRNTAITAFNTAVTANGGSASQQIDRFDVSGNGNNTLTKRKDNARFVQKFIGKSYTDIDNVLRATINPSDPFNSTTGQQKFDLVNAKLVDATNNTTAQTTIGSADATEILTDILRLNMSSTTATLLGGDINLDGTVDVSDLGILAANWQLPNKSWFEGHVNLTNGLSFVDVTDLGILASTWQNSTSLTFNQALSLFPEFSGVVVPEPTTFGLLACVAIGGLMRRRRKA